MGIVGMKTFKETWKEMHCFSQLHQLTTESSPISNHGSTKDNKTQGGKYKELEVITELLVYVMSQP